MSLQQTLGNRAVGQLLQPGMSNGESEPIVGELVTPQEEKPSAAKTGALIGGIVGGIGGIAAGIALAGSIGVGLAALAGLGIAAGGLLLGLGIGALVGGSAHAQRNARVVKVTPSLPEATYDHSLSGAEIRALSTNPNPTDRAGLTQASLFGQLAVTQKGDPQQRQGDKFAYWIDQMEMRLGFRNITVYIANDYPAGSCEYEATREHENEHVNLNRRLLSQYAAKIRRAISEFMPLPTRENPLWVSSEAEGEAAIENINSSVKDGAVGPLYNELRAKLHEGNRELDSAENYQQVHDKCSNW